MIHMHWEVGKKYLLTGGDHVIIYNVNAGGSRPIHGAIFSEKGDESYTANWLSSGKNIGEHIISEFDLTPAFYVEVPKSKRWLAWVVQSSNTNRSYDVRLLREDVILYGDGWVRLPHLDPPVDWQPIPTKEQE